MHGFLPTTRDEMNALLEQTVIVLEEKLREDLSLPRDEAALVLQKLTYAGIAVAEGDGDTVFYRLKK